MTHLHMFNRKPMGWRLRTDLKSFGKPSQKAINRLQMQKRNRRVKITLPSIRGIK